MAAALLMMLCQNADGASMADRLSPRAQGFCERALLMLRSGNYQGTVDQIGHLDTQGVDFDASDREQCAYLLAKALYDTGDPACTRLLGDFALRNPASPYALEASLAQADFFFFEHDFGAALSLYNAIDLSRLDNGRRPLYSYRRALCMVKTGFYEGAEPLLSSLLKNSEYNRAARFYLAYIAYMRNDLDKAYSEFKAVAEAEGADDSPARTASRQRSRRSQTTDNAPMPRRYEYVPSGLEAGYYMTQIDFQREHYSDVADHALSLLEKMPVPELVPEIQRISGISYFKLHDYSQARPMLKAYIDNTSSPADDAVYALGVIEYSEGNRSFAKDLFRRLTDLDNDLSQSAYLYLGQCAVDEGDQNAAAVSFERACRLGYDKDVSETALYNYVASRTHGGNIPFSSSVEMLENFLQRFPSSQYAPQVEEYLATAYYNERDFRRALQSIERIPDPSSSVLAARQKVAYELGVEAMSTGNATEAIRFLQQASESNSDPRIAQAALLWLGDALYATGEYSASEKAYRSFLKGAPDGENRALAIYNLAYALYRQQNWKAAASQFADAASASSLPESLRLDATVHQADCLYYSGNYRAATEAYSRAISAGADAADYATLRRAVMYGHAGDIDRKLKELKDLPSRYPDSKWIADALLETGNTYAALGKVRQAEEAFAKLRKSYSSTPQNRQGSLQLAMTLMKDNQMEKAEETYREIISKWPSSEEAQLANEDLRRYYAATGRLSEYADFLVSVPGAPALDRNDMEILSFEAAERALADDVEATSLLEKYVEQYPDGPHVAQALYDLADAFDAAGRYSRAIECLDRLINSRRDSPQLPGALLLKAEIMEDSSGASHQETLAVYRELERRGGADFAPEAYAGIMRHTDNGKERVDYARRVLHSGGISAEQMEEARFFEALGLRDSGNTDEASSILANLASNPASLAGAKAAVTLGEIQLKAGHPAEAEKTLSEFTDLGTPHQYWLARGFIALADAYHAQNKTYLGIEYLKSLRDNYPGDDLDIHDMIASRLKAWK